MARKKKPLRQGAGGPTHNSTPPAPPMKSSTAPLATPERATEIARLKEFGLREFIELTGISGRYGIYRIDRRGVTVRTQDDEADLAAEPASQVVALLAAEEQLRLVFPCSSENFVKWYDATRGTDGRSSDFPLAPGFLKALADEEKMQLDRFGPITASSKIAAAFKVKPVDKENLKWWDDRLRSAKKYGLASARASQGRASQQSHWSPVMVAAWLIEKEHLTRDAVLRAMQKHFPDCDTDLL
jgi:hypothetical protein